MATLTPPRPLPPYGMLAAGNIDPSKRPTVHNADGTISTVRTISVGTDQGEVLIPTVSPDGRVVSDDEALRMYEQTGKHMGIFKTPDAATMFARQLHDGQADMYGDPAPDQPTGKKVTLTVNGRKVKVDDSFLSLSLEQQEATVNEIAASIGTAEPAAPVLGPGVIQLQGKVSELPSKQPQAAPRPDLLSSTLATVNGISASVPFLQNTTDAIGGTIAQLTGGNYDEYVGHQKSVREGLAKQAPLARGAGELAGYIAAPLALGSTRIGGEALGLTGNLGQRVMNSGLSSAGISTADALSNGETGADALMAGGTGGLLGGLLPVAGAGLRAAGRGISNNIIRPLATAANRENEVTRRVAGAISQDTASGARMMPDMEAIAGRADAEVLNADRFGSAIRTLARTAANVSPEADNAFKSVTDQRFATQGNRAVNFVRQLMGGATDDLALQDNLRTAARATNKTAYDAAYAAPKAKAIWSSKIRELSAATPFKQALKEADEVAANEAAISGNKAIRNPFTFDADGNVTGLRQLPGGGNALPNLEYWDIVQRTLRTKADEAAAGGKRLLAGQIRDMRTALLNDLDTAVPQFKQARRGAAGFFGAEDAIEAGRKAVQTTKATPEIGRAVMAMSPAERDAFSVGFSSEIIDAINATKDRVNVINSIFGSQSARDRIRIALGPQRARELEAYVRLEQVLHMLHTATQGNSTTAKQLIQAGLMGGGAGGLGLIASGGDLTTGMSAATLAVLGRRGLQMAGKHVDDQVMRRVAEVLASPDPAQLQRAIQNAAMSQQHMEALDGIMRALALTAKGGVVGATGSAE